MGNATLKIKVPHWLVQVRIYNHLSELKEIVNNFSKSESTEYLEAEIKLEPGIYEIEYALAEKAEQRLIIIKPGLNLDILDRNSDHWKNLQIGSSMPLESSNEAETKYSDYTANWSTIKTKQSFSAENASIFLSIKIPDEYAGVLLTDNAPNDFQNIFDLKDGEGNSVIDFNKDIERSSEEACIIFNADLTHGSYILEWVNYPPNKSEEERLKNDKCYQPVFLHRNWTTQVFVLTHTPAQKAFSLNMARYGMGFNRNDDTVIAAEAVLETLSQEVKRSIINKEHMQELLSGESQNPWLGILAAYALIPSDTLFFKETTPEELLTPDESLFNGIRDFLKGKLPDHPDVHALHLELSKPTESFKNPPLLKLGLRRVQMHAVRHEETMHDNELVDRILNSSLKNGPWVAWEKLYEPSEVNTSLPQSDSLTDQVIQASEELVSEPAVYVSESVSPKLPIYNIAADTEPNIGMRASMPKSSHVFILQEASLLNLSLELSKAGFQELPMQINIKPTATLFDFLNKAEGKDISIATNLPLSRINASRKNIIEKKEKLQFDEMELTDDEQKIIKYAFKEEGKKSEMTYQSNQTPDNFSDAVESDSSNITQGISDSTDLSDPQSHSITIEECVSKLHSEANHLSVGFGEESNNLVNAVGKKFAERLITIADKLLRRADFTVKTDSEGKTVFANGAFLYLITSRSDYNKNLIEDKNRNIKEENETQKSNQLLWEEVIAKAPIGDSKITSPIENNYFGIWNLKKIELYNEEQKTVLGHLNVLRGIGAPDCKQEIINEVQKNLSSLSLYAPLFGINSLGNGDLFEKKLEEVISKLERIF